MNASPEIRLAQRIRGQRIAAGLTQANAARCTGVGRTTWQRWEQGTVTPKAWRLAAIARAVGVPLSALFLPDSMRAVTEVNLTADAVVRVRNQGAAEATRLAALIASQLPALILAACHKPERLSRPGHGKQRRTRAEVLAGIETARR